MHPVHAAHWDRRRAEAAARGEKVSYATLLEEIQGIPTGGLAGEHREALEALAWRHYFGLALVLTRAGLRHWARRLRKTYLAETAKGPLQATHYNDGGYATFDKLLTELGFYDYNLRSVRTPEVVEALRAYARTAGFFFYQLRHLSDNEHTAPAAQRAEVELARLQAFDRETLRRPFRP